MLFCHAPVLARGYPDMFGQRRAS
nr:truncated I1 [Vector pZS3]